MYKKSFYFNAVMISSHLLLKMAETNSVGSTPLVKVRCPAFRVMSVLISNHAESFMGWSSLLSFVVGEDSSVLIVAFSS